LKYIDRHVVSAALASIALMVAGISLIQSNQVQNDLDKREDAQALLCAWKESMLAQINADWQFLKENPEGTEGISKESVERDIENNRLTLDIISPYLKCEEIREG
jgi:hypothetical protein